MSSDMYAVIKTGGKQYRVHAGDSIQIEKLKNDLGSEFEIKEVLLLGGPETIIGNPMVSGAKITAIVTKQAKTRKKVVFKKKRRHSFRKLHNHKQEFTEIFVKSITSPNGQVAKTDKTPNVVDVAAARQERISQKMADRQERVEGNIGKGRHAKNNEESPIIKKAMKKAAAKKTAKKTTKSSGAKKASAKKKVAKKTSKKA